MLLSIYFYLFHIREKEENHFLMSADFAITESLYIFSLGSFTSFDLERGNITGWKYTQKHGFLF